MKPVKIETEFQNIGQGQHCGQAQAWHSTAWTGTQNVKSSSGITGKAPGDASPSSFSRSP